MTPTLIAALRAMAHADESPNERDIARAKLAEAGVPVDPPRPPAPPAAPAPMPFGWASGSANFTVNFTTNTTWVRWSVG